MKYKLLLTIIIASSVLFACSGLKLRDYPTEDCSQTPSDKTVSIIKDRCALCHRGDFATAELICGRKDMIIDSVTAGRMPKFGSLSEEELNIIKKWN